MSTTGFGCSVSWTFPIRSGPAPLTAEIALWMHVTCAMLLLLPLETIGLVLGHHFGMRDRLIHRMLPPRTRQPP